MAIVKEWANEQLVKFKRTEYFECWTKKDNPIEKILEEILVLFSDEENMRKSARIFKFLEEFRED